MRYMIFAMDKAGTLDIRKANRQAHIDYVQSHALTLELAGPLVAEDGETAIGSLVIVSAENRKQVEDFSDNDPYTKLGLFEDVKIEAFKQTLG